MIGIGSRSVSFKRPIPIDTINKYWGIDSIKNKNEEVVQKQAYRRNYEKFWEFLDTNELDYKEKPRIDLRVSNNAYWGVKKEVQEEHPELKYDPIPGYQGTNRSIVAENIFGMTYKNSLREAEDLLKKIKVDKANPSYEKHRIAGTYAGMQCTAGEYQCIPFWLCLRAMCRSATSFLRGKEARSTGMQ